MRWTSIKTADRRTALVNAFIKQWKRFFSDSTGIQNRGWTSRHNLSVGVHWAEHKKKGSFLFVHFRTLLAAMRGDTQLLMTVTTNYTTIEDPSGADFHSYQIPTSHRNTSSRNHKWNVVRVPCFPAPTYQSDLSTSHHEFLFSLVLKAFLIRVHNFLT